MIRETAEALKYSLYVVTHPFDGFWGLKKEKKGNVTAASVILGILILVFIVSRQLSGYVVNDTDPQDINIFSEILSVVIPVALWCVANWSITTLMDGEGSLKDVYIACVYALVPLILTQVPMIALSRVIVAEEAELYGVIGAVGAVWTAFLIFTGTMTIHNYGILKTVVTVLLVFVGMALMIFLFLLFFALIQQLIDFGLLLGREILLRRM